jgi:hypothetical protein
MLNKVVCLLSDYLQKCQSEAVDAEVFHFILNYFFMGSVPCLGYVM